MYDDEFGTDPDLFDKLASDTLPDLIESADDECASDGDRQTYINSLLLTYGGKALLLGESPSDISNKILLTIAPLLRKPKL